MSVFTPEEITELACEFRKKKKAHLFITPSPMFNSRFFGGAFIALGVFTRIQLFGTMPKAWGSFTSFSSAALFPIGMILVILAGGELSNW